MRLKPLSLFAFIISIAVGVSSAAGQSRAEMEQYLAQAQSDLVTASTARDDAQKQSDQSYRAADVASGNAQKSLDEVSSAQTQKTQAIRAIAVAQAAVDKAAQDLQNAQKLVGQYEAEANSLQIQIASLDIQIQTANSQADDLEAAAFAAYLDANSELMNDPCGYLWYDIWNYGDTLAAAAADLRSSASAMGISKIGLETDLSSAQASLSQASANADSVQNTYSAANAELSAAQTWADTCDQVIAEQKGQADYWIEVENELRAQGAVMLSVASELDDEIKALKSEIDCDETWLRNNP